MRTWAAVALCAAVGCQAGERRVVGPETERELGAARGATIPDGVRLADMSGPRASGLVVLADWSFETQGDWAGYSAHVEPLLRAQGYDVQAVGGTLRASKATAGDLYGVIVMLEQPGPTLRVRIAFTASPD